MAEPVGSGSDEPRELWRGGFATWAMLPAWIATGEATLMAPCGGRHLAECWRRWLVLLAALAVLWLYQLATLAFRRLNVICAQHAGIHP